jgi:amino acid adenylation domain-containing protein
MYRSLHSLLEGSAKRFPSRPAVLDPSGTRLTYIELHEKANAISEQLAPILAGRGSRVGLLARKSGDLVSAIFGVLRASGAYVPVDPTAPLERAAYIFANCAVEALVIEEGLLEGLTKHFPGRLEVIAPIAPELLLVRATMDRSGIPPGDPSLAYILYTSGSTGRPKGVMVLHSTALGFVDWCSEVFEPSETDVFANHSPFHFDLSILDLFVSIKHGASIVLINDQLGKQPLALPELIESFKITIWYSTPAILRMMLDFGKMERFSYDSLRMVLFAGEVFPVKHLRELKRIWRRQPHYNLYGPTETNVCTFMRIPDSIPEDRTEPYPIGAACSHCRTAVMGPAHVPVPKGEEGELYVSGVSVMPGYWNLPEQNEKAFVTDAEGVRWYRTGDVVVDDGGIYLFRGRRDRMVKRRSYRVELGEIESALYRHSKISEAAVVATPDAENGVLIVGFYSSVSHERLSLIELKKYCIENLPQYMIPDRFLMLEEIPKTSTDKIDYQELRNRVTG